MRQWLGVNPKILCRQHLTGEFFEHFKFRSALRKQINLDGYFRSNCLEPLSLQSRFDALHAEMKLRGYKHKSLKFPPELLQHLGHAKYIKINKEKNFKELMSRCIKCYIKFVAERFFEKNGLTPIKINCGYCEDFANIILTQFPESEEYCTETVADSFSSELAGHIWVFSNGKHYDVECPEGVEDWKKLPIFQLNKQEVTIC